MATIHEPSGLTDPSLSLFQRMQIGLLMLLVTACGALSAAAWQAVDAYADREAAHVRELESFHARLVWEMRRLSENAGMLTSVDLCPVRFRVRLSDKRNPPARKVDGSLTCLDDSTQPILIPMGGDGVFNFGLVPPGHYRLELQNQDDYRLAHEFDVVPGVPVDRLVLCPHNVHVPHLTTRIDPESSGPLSDRGLVMLYYVERDDLTVGEWTWQPGYRAGVWVAAASGGPNVSAEEGDPTVDMAPFADVLPAAPFPDARCTAIAVFQYSTGDKHAPSFLGTFRFRPEADRDFAGDAWPEPVFVIDAPPPRHFRSIHDREAPWIIELPLAMTREIEERVHEAAPASYSSELPMRAGLGPWLETLHPFVPPSIVHGKCLWSAGRVGVKEHR